MKPKKMKPMGAHEQVARSVSGKAPSAAERKYMEGIMSARSKPKKKTASPMTREEKKKTMHSILQAMGAYKPDL